MPIEVRKRTLAQFVDPRCFLANAPHVVAAVQRAAGTVPIVFVAVSDPVGAGFIKNLARPGGNLTGLLNYEASITGKWMAMLKEIAPSLTRVALMGNPYTTDWLQEIKQDGCRLMAQRPGVGGRLLTRNGNDCSARYPSALGAISR